MEFYRLDAVQIGAAKAFLQYITGQEWAAWYAKTYPYTLLARYEGRNQSLKRGRTLELFYSLKSNTTANKPMNQVSEEMWRHCKPFRSKGRRAFL